MRKSLLILSVFLAIGVGGAILLWPQPPSDSPKPQKTSGLLKEASPKEILTYVRSLKSQVVLLNFWASWCAPCRDEFPLILSLRRKLRPAGLQVVFVSIDETNDFDSAENFLEEQQVDFPGFFKGSQSLEFVTQLFPDWHGAVPATLLLGPKSEVLESWEGIASSIELEQRIQRHLHGSS